VGVVHRLQFLAQVEELPLVDRDELAIIAPRHEEEHVAVEVRADGMPRSICSAVWRAVWWSKTANSSSAAG
jgi:hypothetical protein